MDTLSNILIKEADGDKRGDKAFFVDNIPKTLLYRKARKMVPDYTHPQQHMVPDFELDDRGRKIPTNATIDELLPGIEMSQTGDGAYLFMTSNREAKERLTDIDNYIKAEYPVLDRVPQRDFISSAPGHLMASPKPLHLLPRVVLPALVSPPAKAVQEVQATVGTVYVPVEKKRKQMTEEQKAAARTRMANARAQRNLKPTA